MKIKKKKSLKKNSKYAKFVVILSIKKGRSYQMLKKKIVVHYVAKLAKIAVMKLSVNYYLFVFVMIAVQKQNVVVVAVNVVNIIGMIIIKITKFFVTVISLIEGPYGGSNLLQIIFKNKYFLI